TSMLVYPAAGLIQYAKKGIPKYIIDIKLPETGFIENLIKIEAPASVGTKIMSAQIKEKYV
ncbi:MAG: NAD-dependent deacylase, partial [Cyclobacteriaceae bacterium]|nr:NAD-dependent deacylase [Cyclobacteriaceae bacterium]